MSINSETVKVLESLTKLTLCEEEKEAALERMTALEESFQILSEFDTEGVEPLVQVTSLGNVLREDVAAKFVTREQLLFNAPEQNRGYFQVPKTLE